MRVSFLAKYIEVSCPVSDSDCGESSEESHGVTVRICLSSQIRPKPETRLRHTFSKFKTGIPSIESVVGRRRGTGERATLPASLVGLVCLFHKVKPGGRRVKISRCRSPGLRRAGDAARATALYARRFHLLATYALGIAAFVWLLFPLTETHDSPFWPTPIIMQSSP